MIQISDKPHLWSINKIREHLESGKLSIKELEDSLINTITFSETKIKAWEIYTNSFKNTKPNLPLAGLFIGVKDNINTLDFPTLMGAKEIWGFDRGGFDARIISRLKYAGVQIVGKTKTSEFAVHAPTDTLNPLYPDSIVGTSSSGSAAAVAAGHVSVSLGTQTAGSIARPASFCGVIGFKPSFGDLPRTGVLKTTENFDQVGFLGARINDLREVYNSAKVSGKNHPIHTARRNNHFVPKRIMIVNYDNSIEIDKELNENYMMKVYQIAEYFKLNVEFISAQKLEHFRMKHKKIYIYNLRIFLKEEISSGQISKILHDFLNQYKNIDLDEIREFEMLISNYSQEFNAEYEDSVICSLASQFSAPKIGSTEGLDLNFVWTSFGLPQIVLPLLLDSNKKKVGLSLVSPIGTDIQLLNFCEKLFPNSIYDNSSG